MKAVNAPDAPSAIGPYSHAIINGNLVFCSGQIGLDPETMELAGPDIEIQTTRVLKNLEAVLVKAGASLGTVLKTTVFLITMDDFAQMNQVYQEKFAPHKPARSTIAVSELPKGARVEIECIALIETAST